MNNSNKYFLISLESFNFFSILRNDISDVITLDSVIWGKIIKTTGKWQILIYENMVNRTEM